MLRIRGNRDSLITALVDHWLDHTLQLPAPGARRACAPGKPDAPKESQQRNHAVN